MSGAAVALWEAHTDPVSGDTYFATEDGSESLWNLPDGAVLVDGSRDRGDRDKAEVSGTETTETNPVGWPVGERNDEVHNRIEMNGRLGLTARTCMRRAR